MTGKARVAGILAIIAGGLGVFSAIWMFFFVFFFRFIMMQPEVAKSSAFPAAIFGLMTLMYVLMGVFYLLLSALAITGGVFALKKKYWGWALAGAIAGAVTFSPCGIAAIIFISMGHEEFNSPAVGAGTS